VHHWIKTLLIQARGHRVERLSGRALLPDDSEIMLANAPLVTDRITGERSVRWGTLIWPVIDMGDPIRLGHSGEDL
jgi:hypothetical protein